MLTRLHITNFKTLENFSFEPTPGLSVLIGENGSGKSNLGDALHLLSRFASGVSMEELVSLSARSRWATNWALAFDLEFGEGDEQLQYHLLIAIDPQTSQVRVGAEDASRNGFPVFQSSGGAVTLPTMRADKPLHFRFPDWDSFLGIARTVESTEEFSLRAETVRALHRLPSLMGGLRVFKLDPTRMSGRSEREDPTLDRDGANFGSWFRWFSRTASKGRYDSFLQSASGPLPGLVGLEAVSAGQGVTELVARFEIKGKLCEFTFRELSDGQRQLMCLYLLNTSIEVGQVLLFDEPDNFLSIREVQPWLSELERIAEERGAQAFVASHGTEAMDFLGSRKAWLFTRPDRGPTRVEALDGSSLPSEAILYGYSTEVASK